jgi:hypothetical protein
MLHAVPDNIRHFYFNTTFQFKTLRCSFEWYFLVVYKNCGDGLSPMNCVSESNAVTILTFIL